MQPYAPIVQKKRTTRKNGWLYFIPSFLVITKNKKTRIHRAHASGLSLFDLLIEGLTQTIP